MIAASVTAARERMRKFALSLTIVETVAAAIASALAVVISAAIQSDVRGQEWPDAVTALIAAGFGAAVIGGLTGWAILACAQVLARRIDVGTAKGDQALRETQALRANQEMTIQAAQSLIEGQRSLITELGRMRMVEWYRSEELQRLVTRWAMAEQRHRREVRQVVEVAATKGYLKGQADAGQTPDPATLRQIYWRVYSDVMDDLAGGPGVPGDG